VPWLRSQLLCRCELALNSTLVPLFGACFSGALYGGGVDLGGTAMITAVSLGCRGATDDGAWHRHDVDCVVRLYLLVGDVGILAPK
jgi:hypothetical protein